MSWRNVCTAKARGEMVERQTGGRQVPARPVTRLGCGLVTRCAFGGFSSVEPSMETFTRGIQPVGRNVVDMTIRLCDIRLRVGQTSHFRPTLLAWPVRQGTLVQFGLLIWGRVRGD